MDDNSQSIVVETTQRIFADLCDPQTVNAATGDTWKGTLWRALEEAGLTLAWVPEEAGGTGAGLLDGFDIARISGQYAVPVPLGETMLAGWALAQAGLTAEPGSMAFAPVRDGTSISIASNDTMSGRAKAVPFAATASRIVVLAERDGQPVVATVAPEYCTFTERASDMGGERVDITFVDAPAQAVAPLNKNDDANALRMMGAALRASQMTGALESMLHISTQYSTEREAFGRTISKFQAVQHNLAQLGAEVAAALTASGSAADTYENDRQNADALFLEVASAKIRVGEAVEKGAAIAHQVHGAIGFTAEHILQRFSRRVWGWRDDFGSESQWASDLGEVVVAEGSEALWPRLTTR